VSRKPKHRHPAPLSPAELENRVNRALREGRTQQALELAKQLYKHDSSAHYKDLLQNTYLARARQLRSMGYLRDASTVLANAVQLGGAPAFLEKLAEELASSGDVRGALKILEQVPGSQAAPRVMGQAADAALREGKQGRNLLPESLQGQFDLIVQAFAQSEAGQDEQARATLQGIGLQSPFLEWKLLLRGLLAYYQNDDVRAIENWQRLNPERLPARLAAPLRFRIDPAYRTSQPPATQTQLQAQADRLQGAGLMPALRAIQASLAHEHHLPQAFRQIENLLPQLRREFPQVIPRLAACCYWAIISHGVPEDLRRYQRVFGTPPDDPKLARLEALALEHRHELEEAHRFWQTFEQTVSQNPAAWPGDQANRVRALVWSHMGHNAASIPDVKDIPHLPPFLRDHPDRPKPLKPTAEECYERSLELAPDQLATYADLVEYYEEKHKPKKAEQAARRLLKRFPDHVLTLEKLADLLMEKGEYQETLGLYERALKSNPLESRLRAKLGSAHLYYARTRAEAGAFDEARAEYQHALTLEDRASKATVLVKWAACEFKAGVPERAEELLAQAHTEEGNRLAVAFSMLIEVIRLKLPRTLKTRFDKEFNALLAEPPTGQGAAALADTAASHRLAGVTYFGQKTHEKKVLTYLDKARKADFTEEQLAKVCADLQALKAARLQQAYLQLGQTRFPKSPMFFYLEARQQFALGPGRMNLWRLKHLLEMARQLATAMPRDPRQEKLLEDIGEMEKAIGAFSPFGFGGMMPSMEELGDYFDSMLDSEEEAEDEDDWG
jgi:tetratricopeptide (TPR) repeat protein